MQERHRKCYVRKQGSKSLKKRRMLVKVTITHKVVVQEDLPLSTRVNARKPRVQTRFPFGSCSRTRRRLAEQHNITVSKSTIWRDSKKMGLHARKRPSGPGRYLGDEEKRLEYAQKNLEFAKKHANKMVFVDEKWFDSLDCDLFCYCVAGEVPAARERDRYPPKVHCFGLVGVGVRALVIFPAGEKVSSDVYMELCLKPHLNLLKGRYFVHDNAGAHVGVADWLVKKKIDVIKHPARSPDMNPIERMWSIIAKKVSATGPLTQDKLATFVQKEWDEIDQLVIDRTVLSWPKQLEAVIANKGATSSKHLPQQRGRERTA